jgi:hypothetical protein
LVNGQNHEILKPAISGFYIRFHPVKRKGIKRRHAHSCLSQDFIDLSKWMKIKTTNKLIPAIFNNKPNALTSIGMF